MMKRIINYRGKISRLFGAVMALGLTLSLQSCFKDFNKELGSDWEPEMALPLGKGDLTVYDIIKHVDSSGLFIIDSTKMVELVYEGKNYVITGDKIINLPDQSFSKAMSLTPAQITTLQSSSSVTTTTSYTQTFSISGGALLDSMILKAGTLGLTVNSEFKHSGRITLELPGFVKGGSTLKKTVSFNYTGGTLTTASDNADLTGYHADLSNGGASHNQMQMKVTLSLDNSGNSTSTTDVANLQINMSGMKYSKIYGYFGQQIASQTTDSVLLKIFSKAIAGNFRLVNPRIQMTLTNYFGIPVAMSFDNISSINTVTHQVTPIVLNPNFPNPLSIPSPLTTSDSTVTKVTFDRTNSSISNIVDPTPKYISYQLGVKTYPNGPTGKPGFLTDDSKIKVKTRVELPLEGWASGFHLMDTLKINIGNDENVKKLKTATIVFKMLNGFPVDMKVKFYLLDENKKMVDSIGDDSHNLIAAAYVASDGKVSQPTTKFSEIEMSQSQTDHLLQAKYLLISGQAESLSAHQGLVVKIYDDYVLHVAAGIRIKGKVK